MHYQIGLMVICKKIDKTNNYIIRYNGNTIKMNNDNKSEYDDNDYFDSYDNIWISYDENDNIIMYNNNTIKMIDDNGNEYDDYDDQLDNMCISYDDDDNIILKKSNCYMIYNENNKLILKKNVVNIINKYIKKKITVNDIKNIELYRTAVTHVSYTKSAYIKYDNKKNILSSKIKKYQALNIDISSLKKNDDDIINLRKDAYERLEFLGDAAIHYVLANYFYHRYDKNNEGFLTKMRSGIAKGKNISKLGTAIGLAPYILLSKEEEKTHGRDNNEDLLEDTFEAFVGAIHEELGKNICEEFIISVMENHIDITTIHNDNYIELLLNYYKEKQWKAPKYIDMPCENTETGNTQKLYQIGVTGKDGKIKAMGVAHSRKTARQNAAKQALKNFKVID